MSDDNLETIVEKAKRVREMDREELTALEDLDS